MKDGCVSRGLAVVTQHMCLGLHLSCPTHLTLHGPQWSHTIMTTLSFLCTVMETWLSLCVQELHFWTFYFVLLIYLSNTYVGTVLSWLLELEIR